LLILLGLAVRASGLPLKVFDSSSGFRLPDGSVLSPDASLLRQEHWEALTPEERCGFAPLCPDLAVELASPRRLLRVDHCRPSPQTPMNLPRSL
jgi:Uma2 family endonuclease